MPIKSKKENILVIGATGLIGNALVERLRKQGKKITIISRKKQYYPSGITVLHGDLLNANFCARVLKGVDTVFYSASHRKNLEWHLKHPWLFAKGNVVPILNVLEALTHSSVKKFLYMSTIQVEYATDDKSPIDGYAFGKSINEMLVRAFSQQNKGIDVKIIRSTAVYGPGDSFDPKEANLIPSIIHKVDKAKKTVEIWGKGTRKIQFVYVDDVVPNLLAIAKVSKQNFFVLGNPKAYSILQMVDMVIKESKKELTIKHDLSKPDNLTKLFKFHNKVKPRVGLRGGLRRTIKYYHEQYG